MFSSGLIAGGAITGVALAAFQAKGLDAAFAVPKAASSLVGFVVYVVLLAVPVYLASRAHRSSRSPTRESS